MALIYEYQCPKCLREFEEVRSVSERNNVFCCGVRSEKFICTNPQIEDDQMWNFNAGYFGDSPVHVHGKDQHKRLLKEYGLVDETPSNCLTVKKTDYEISKDIKKTSTNLANKIAKKCHGEGISQKSVNSFVKKLSNKDLKVRDVDYKPISVS